MRVLSQTDWEAGKIPNPKFQIPNKLQAPNSKNSRPSCASMELRRAHVWNLEFGASLELGIWDLEFARQ